MELSLTAVWSAPFDTRQHRDGAWYGVMGGAHQPLYMRTTFGLPPHHVEDPRTRGNFGRDAADGQRYFAMPRQFGEIGGGTIHLDVIVFTRDGRSALEPAPLRPLLDIEVARLTRVIAEADKASAGALRELEASMTPDAVAQRRAKREAAWSRETRDPAAMARRLDAVHFPDNLCGEWWDSVRPPAGGNACARYVPTLKDLDWAAIRRALGW